MNNNITTVEQIKKRKVEQNLSELLSNPETPVSIHNAIADELSNVTLDSEKLIQLTLEALSE